MTWNLDQFRRNGSVAEQPNGGNVMSPSEVAGRMDQELAEQRNQVVAPQDWEQALVEPVTVSRERFFKEIEGLADDLESLFESLNSNKVTVEKTKLYRHSRIRVQLSRPLTVAEVEKITTDHHVIGGRLNTPRREDDGFLVKLRVNPSRTHVWVDADLPSRLLYEVIAAALDSHFVNIYPTAVRTFTEYHA